MKEKLSEQVERCLRSHSRKKNRARLLRVLALVVVFVTVYMLIVPAVTLSNETTCGMEAHTHSEKCYELRMVSPEPEIICGAENLSGIILHVHDEYCYADGKLICTLPEQEGHVHTDECYQEQQELICTEAQEQGHTHSSQCYAYDRGELTCGLAEGEGHVHDDSCYTVTGGELICTEPESEGHTHDDSCYTVTRTEVLTCPLSESEDVYDEETGELIEAGHTHDSSCYTVEETEELTCTLEESAGHTHGESCYAPETRELTCTLSEGEGHVHDDSCYEWIERLTCTEAESEQGHVHTDECYKHTSVLTCTKEEIVPHTHGEDCYDEDGVLICGKPEAEAQVHQHTAACISVPEGEPVEEKVLVCGLEEHVHTDECYKEIVPELGEKYFCGLAEHTHDADCWFDSGELRCTLPEHLHSADCLDPEKAALLWPDTAVNETVWIDDTFEYDTAEFRMTFHVRGYAVPAVTDSGELSASQGHSDKPLPSASASGSGNETDAGQSVPDTASHAPQESESEPSETAEPVTEPPAEPEPSDENGLTEPAAEPSDGGEEFAAPRGGGEGDEPEPSGSDTEPEQDAEVSFEVTEEEVDVAGIALAEDFTGSADASVDGESEAEDTAETLLKRSITIIAKANGMELDISGCQITVEITPTEQLISSLDESAATFDMRGDDEISETGGQEQIETVMTLSDENEGVVASTGITEGASLQTELPGSKFDLSVISQANPTFIVEYYAYLSTVDSRSESATNRQLSVIDTSGGKLPQNNIDQHPNGTDNPLRNMYLDSDGNVVMRRDAQPIYRTHMYKYASAPGLQYVNIIGNKVMKEENETNLLKNYELKEIWVQLGDDRQSVMGELVQPYDDAVNENGDRIITETVRDENGNVHTISWKVVEWNESVRLTNLAMTAENNPNCILIEENSVIRLVYDTTNNPADNKNADFYDYDITDGKPNGKRLNTSHFGINSDSNYNDTPGVRYAFGAANAGTDYGWVRWWNEGKNNAINTANREGIWGTPDNTYGQLTFGLVTGISDTGNVEFADGIVGPEIFGNTPQEGKTQYEKQDLTFIRKGDTYTLSGTSVNGYSITGLDKFNNTTNNFWALDGVENVDPHFGVEGDYQYKDGAKWINMPKGDDNKAHNNYFGMKFAVDFELSEDYIGPLEYWFFGDDDMWVFLTPLDENGEPNGGDQLICDIGGVHVSRGEYVNLWDYVDPDRNKSEIVDVTAGEGYGNAGTQKYRLTVFYTERGASGSTCWMQFTLPTLAGVRLEDTIREEVDKDHGALWIEKEVVSSIPEDMNEEFTFTLELEGGDGVDVGDTYIAYIRTANGEIKPYGENGDNAITREATFTLKNGESLAITNLPKGARYTIYEVLEESDRFTTTVDTTVEYLKENDKYGEKPYVTGPDETLLAAGTVEGATMTTVHYLNKSTVEVVPPLGDGDTGVLWVEKTLEGVRGGQLFHFDLTIDFSPIRGNEEDWKKFYETNPAFDHENNTFTTTVYTRNEKGEYDWFNKEKTHTFKLSEDGTRIETTISIKDKEAIIITGLPPGTEYSLTETEKSREGFNVVYMKLDEKFDNPKAENEETPDESGNLPPEDKEAGEPATDEENAQPLPDYGETTRGVIEAGMADKIECVNTAKFTFPETGASIENSTIMYTLAGTLLVLAACCLWYSKRELRRGAAD